MVPRFAAAYARAHPDERRLTPDEDASEDPASSATAQLEVVELLGPYASYEYHADVELEGARPWHMTRRGVIDLRSGRQVTVEDLVGEDAARRVTELGRRAFQAAQDSMHHIRDTLDERNARALDALKHLRFDETSFTLVAIDGRPAIRIAVTGRGEGLGGTAIELEATPVEPRPWWDELGGALPDNGGTEELDQWIRPSYRVLARYDSSGDVARLSIAAGGREWPVGSVGPPIHRLDWLDSPPIDSTERRALGRAFDEAAAYDEHAKVARSRSTAPFLLARSVRRLRSP
jgi:hypothetical protein